MKLSFVALFFAALLASCVMMAITVSAMPRDHATIRRLRNDNACIDNITDSVGQVGAAVGEIIRAIGDCPKPNNTDSCVADIAKVASYLAEAGAYVSQAVIACSNGKDGSPCVTDLIQLGHDLTDAASEVAQALGFCKDQNAIQCIEELELASKHVESIFADIRKAIADCRSLRRI